MRGLRDGFSDGVHGEILVSSVFFLRRLGFGQKSTMAGGMCKWAKTCRFCMKTSRLRR